MLSREDRREKCTARMLPQGLASIGKRFRGKMRMGKLDFPIRQLKLLGEEGRSGANGKVAKSERLSLRSQ